MQISQLSSADLPGVAAVHTRAFPRSALTALGAEAVRRYYEWQLVGPHDVVALGAWSNGALAGFCFGGVFRGALSGFVRSNRNYLVRRVLIHPWLALNPLFRDRLASGIHVLGLVRRKPDTGRAEVPSPTGRSFGILAIAVDPALQRAGIGRMLLAAAEDHALQGAFRRMHLTVQPENQQAVRFYEGLGWHKVETRETWNGEMARDLSSSLDRSTVGQPQ